LSINYAIKKIIYHDLNLVKVNKPNMRLRSWTIKKNWVQQFFYSFFLSKIDTYKIKNQQNIKVTRKKNQTKTNYVTQLIINQILSDEIKKKTRKKYNCNG
jgi:hypothetical protein